MWVVPSRDEGGSLMRKVYCSQKCMGLGYRKDMRECFAAKVDKAGANGCWNWTASLREKGYGQFMWRNKMHRAHRLAWQWARGPIPKGMHVLHTCDNRRCVNPDHLRLGTHQENMAEMWERGRHPTKVTAEQVRAIRLRADGTNDKELAKEYGFKDHKSIWAIRTGRKWSHVT